MSAEDTPVTTRRSIVDDNEKNRKLARDVLRAAGFRTLEAATAREGIALAGEHVPDVILMDLRLPDMDGAEAARSSGTTADGADPGRRAERAAARGKRRLARGGRLRRLAREADQRRATFPEQVRRYCASDGELTRADGGYRASTPHARPAGTVGTRPTRSPGLWTDRRGGVNIVEHRRPDEPERKEARHAEALDRRRTRGRSWSRASRPAAARSADSSEQATQRQARTCTRSTRSRRTSTRRRRRRTST